ncbi:MAG: hypothetical protein QXV17_07865 [Candidatus Micrarchaeaceae archaeon]
MSLPSSQPLLTGSVLILPGQIISVGPLTTSTVGVNYTSGGAGYVEVFVSLPAKTGAAITINSASFPLSNGLNNIPVNYQDTINNILLTNSNTISVGFVISSRIIPLS